MVDDAVERLDEHDLASSVSHARCLRQCFDHRRAMLAARAIIGRWTDGCEDGGGVQALRNLQRLSEVSVEVDVCLALRKMPARVVYQCNQLDTGLIERGRDCIELLVPPQVELDGLNAGPGASADAIREVRDFIGEQPFDESRQPHAALRLGAELPARRFAISNPTEMAAQANPMTPRLCRKPSVKRPITPMTTPLTKDPT